MDLKKAKGRLLAPLAIIAALVAIVTLWNGFRATTSDSAKNDKKTTSTTTTGKSQSRSSSSVKQQRKKKVRSVYVVKSGDSLSIVAEKTGVSVQRLQTLNPDIDPRALVIGQRVKLKE